MNKVGWQGTSWMWFSQVVPATVWCTPSPASPGWVQRPQLPPRDLPAHLVIPLRENHLPSPMPKGLIPGIPETQGSQGFQDPHLQVGPPAAALGSTRDGRNGTFRAQGINSYPHHLLSVGILIHVLLSPACSISTGATTPWKNLIFPGLDQAQVTGNDVQQECGHQGKILLESSRTPSQTSVTTVPRQPRSNQDSSAWSIALGGLGLQHELHHAGLCLRVFSEGEYILK